MKGSAAIDDMYKAMELGKVSSDKILPIVGKLMKASAAGGIDAARTSSIAEQARAENAQTALLDTFSKNGGEAGFARFWKTIAWAMKELEPLVKGMAGLFERLSVVVQAPIRAIGALGAVVGHLSQQLGWSEKNIVSFAALGTLLLTKWGRVGLVFTSMMLVIEDLAFAAMGKGSVAGNLMKWFEDITSFQVDDKKVIFAVAAGFVAIAASLMAIRGVKFSLPSVLGGSKGGPDASSGGGKKGGGWKTNLLAGATALGLSTMGQMDETDAAFSMLALTYPKVGLPAIAAKKLGYDPGNLLYTQYRMADMVVSDPSSPAYGMDQSEIVKKWRSYSISDSSIGADPVEFADFVENYVQSLKDDAMYSGKMSQQLILQEGAIQMNVETNDNQRLANELQNILGGVVQDAYIEVSGGG